MIKRGEIWLVDCEPTDGTEQQGRRPVLVVSPEFMNALGLSFVCPISRGANVARSAGLTVPLLASGTDTQGVILCHQLRVVDLVSRKARKFETAPDFVVDEVLGKLQAILE